MKSRLKKGKSTKKSRLKKGKSTNRHAILNGGPWAGQKVFVPDETMVFSCHGWRGFYRYGVWHGVQ